MAAQAELAFKRKIQGTDQITNFFMELEALRIPEEMVREQYPQAFVRWQTLGRTQSTPWTWVMMLELCLVSFLAPTAALRPIPSITVYAILWFFFVHPGSTSTSNLLRLYGDALDVIEDRARADRVRRREEFRQQQGKGQGQGKGPANNNPFSGATPLGYMFACFGSSSFLCSF
jgi:hypothetical protein